MSRSIKCNATFEHRLGRLNPGTKAIDGEIAANDFLELPISARHAAVAGNLPPHHDDPFDRIMVAQAQTEDLMIVTHDKRFGEYKVTILWT